MKRAFVVLNPVAGNSDADHIRWALERYLGGGSWAYEVYETTGQERVAEIVRAALERDVDLFLAAGGDGTASDVAGGLVHTGVPLGIVPVGTGNALARGLGIPLNPEEALRLMTGAHGVRTIDAMRVGDRFFLLNVGTGISSLTVRRTDQQDKRHLGRIAYVWRAAKAFLGFQPRRFTIVVDGQRTQLRGAEAIVLNSAALGDPLLRWGPQVHVDDGRVDVRLMRAGTLLDYLGLAWMTLLGRQDSDPRVRCLSAERRIAIDVYRPLPVQGDGDIVGRTPVEIEVVPSAVRVVVPDA